jgi:hypothetical protein
MKILSKRHPKPLPAYAGSYDPTCITEDFIFPYWTAGRGSRVETLPEDTGYDKAQLDELTRCKNDAAHFMNKHCRLLPTGDTNTMLAYSIWLTCFHPLKRALIGSASHAQIVELRSRLDVMFKQLPDWIKPGTSYSGRTSLELNNGSRVYFQVISESFGRGISYNFAYLDSFKQVKPDLQEFVVDRLVPSMVKGAKLVISTEEHRQ